MSLPFLFVGLALAGGSRLQAAIRWIFIGGFVFVMVSLVAISLRFGAERLVRFEILVISIDWLVLMVNGVLLARLFRRRMNRIGGQAS